MNYGNRIYPNIGNKDNENIDNFDRIVENIVNKNSDKENINNGNNGNRNIDKTNINIGNRTNEVLINNDTLKINTKTTNTLYDFYPPENIKQG